MSRSASVPADAVGVDAIPLLFDGPEVEGAGWRLVVAPGAGAPMTSDFLTRLAGALATQGVQVVRFDFPYMVRGRKAPDRPPVLEATWRLVLDHLAAQPGPAPDRTAIGGKSMGGRIATQVLASEPPSGVDACVLFGYPLHPPGKPDRLRDAHLASARVPQLYFSGDRDALARIDLLRATVDTLAGQADLVVFDEANHDFKLPKRTGRTREELIDEMAERTAKWLGER